MPPSDSSHPSPLNDKIIDLLEQFRVAWKSGRRDAIGSLLPPESDPDYGQILLALIKSELHWSWKQYGDQLKKAKEGDTVDDGGYRVERYQKQFQWLREHPEHIPQVQQWEDEFRRRFAATGEVARLTSVPGYAELEWLGEGGMSVVYKARHVTLNRLVALKLLRSGTAADQEEVTRFRKEAKALASLQHPGIVQIHDFGEYHGRLYLSLEYCPNDTLKKYLTGKRPAPAMAAETVRCLAETMQVAHEAGVVHRDLKPGNVLFGEREELKVADFGLAKLLGASNEQTRVGQVMGTPSYMAPEQAEGSLSVGAAADVYALGAILYALLTGRPPFPITPGVDLRGTLQEVQSRDPEPPSRHNGMVPRDLETICLKCLEKAPVRRYGSARELAEDLRRFLSYEPIQARRPGYAMRLLLWGMRNPLRGALTAAVLVLLVATLWATGGWLTSRAAAAREAQLTALEGTYAEARLLLPELRQLKDGPGGERAVEDAREFARRIRDLRTGFAAGAKLLGDRARLRVAPSDWGDLQLEVRNEVTPWLTTIRLRERQRIALPGHLEAGVPLALAVRSEQGAVAELAVLAAGTADVFLLSPDGRERQRLRVPAQMVKVSKATSATVRRRALHSVQTKTDTNYSAFHLDYVRPGELTYQVQHHLVAWDSTTGRQIQMRELPEHDFPHPLAGRTHAYSARFIAAVDERDVTVTLRSWEPGARPVVVWRAAGGDPAGGGERVEQIVFGVDGRALFILSNHRLAVLDTATGAAAEIPLSDTPFLSARQVAPCPGGLALVEQRKREGAKLAELTYWNVTLPATPVRSLRHDAPVRSVAAPSNGGEPLVVVGTADHVLRAWSGATPRWEAGVPFLDSADRGTSRRGRRAEGGAEGGTVKRSWKQSGATGDPGKRRYGGMETAAAPVPYSGWAFLAGPTSRFLAQRVVGSREGDPDFVTEIHAIALGAGQQGRLELTYPSAGPGQLLATDPHLRFVVTRAKENGYVNVVTPADGKLLGRIGPLARRGGPLKIDVLAGLQRSDYLLIGQRGFFGGGDLEVWRIGDQPTRVGRVYQPEVFAAALPVDLEGNRAIVWRTRMNTAGPYFAQVIDLEKGQEVCKLEGFESVGILYSSLHTPDHFVAVCHQGLGTDANDPYRVLIWDLRTGRRSFFEDLWTSASLPEIELSPDGRKLAVCGNLHQTGLACVRLYELNGPSPIGQPYLRPWPATPRFPALANTYVVAALDDHPHKGASRSVRLSWSDGAEVEKPEAAELVVAQRFYSGITGWLLWKGRDGLSLQDSYRGRPKPLEQTASLARDLQFLNKGEDGVVWPNNGGKVVALLGPEGGVWRWNETTDSWKRVLQFPREHRFLDFDVDQRWALTVAPGTGEIRVWDVLTGKVARRCLPRASRDAPIDPGNTSWQLSPDGKHLAGLSQGLLRVWDLDANRAVLTIPKAGHSEPPTCLAQHAGQRRVASGDNEGLVFLWGRDDGRLLNTLIAHSAPVSALAFPPAGTGFASAATDGTVALWGLDGQRRWSAQVSPTASVTRLAFAPERARLFAGTGDGRVVVLDLEDGKLRHTHRSESARVLALAVSPDGKAVAVGTGNGVALWYGEDAEPRRLAKGSPVTAVAFGGAGQLLATGGRQVQFWDVGTGKAVWALDVPRGPVQSLALDESTGELVVADNGPDVTVFRLADLHRELKSLGLGLDNFPATKWPESAPAQALPEPSLDHWVRRAKELYEQREWLQLGWVSTTATKKWPDDPGLWFYVGASARNHPDLWEDARRAYLKALSLSGVRRPEGSTGRMIDDLARLHDETARVISLKR